ncbi:MAG: 30S ribosomal protein S6 [Lentisphaeria bacterium]|nr:30S ribosomal protein S6 [Candidatus Neomarinimicrobiota bacterium]MCF7842747.1 30S ribosomal protein S6 [Lentisphaeria bacterium]
MRNYECLFIVNPNFDGDGISTVIEKVTGYVKEADAEVANIQHWGKRRLAYQIQKQQYGNYVLMHLNGEAPKITDLQRSLELDDSVLAYLTVRLDEMPEFDKVMIPEDESEDDRRGGRSRYDDSRSRDRDSYSRRPRSADSDDEAEGADLEGESDSDVKEAAAPAAETEPEAADAPVAEKSSDSEDSESESESKVDSTDADEEADKDESDDDKADTDTDADAGEDVDDKKEEA